VSPTARRNVRLLSAFNFCSDFRVYAPVMVIYFQHVTGSYALAVLLFSIAKIATSVFEVPTGTLSDLAGRKLTLLLGQIASVFSIALYALDRDFAVLAGGAVLEGLAFALFSGNNDALLYDTLKGEGAAGDFAHWQGRVSAMFQIALAVSAAVATLALIWLPLRAMFVLSLVPQIVGLGFAVFFVEPPRGGRTIPTNIFAHLREAVAGFVRDVRLRELSLASMLGFGLGEAQHMFYPAFFALFWPPWALGIAGLLTHAFAAIGFRGAGKLIARFREFRVLLWCNVGGIAIGALSVGLPTVASPALSTAGSFLFGPGVVAQGSLMQKAFSDAQRATMASLISLGGNILFAIAVFALGWAADRIGPRYALLIAQLLSIPVALLYWRLYRAVRTER
jgi:MFS family permease